MEVFIKTNLGRMRQPHSHLALGESLAQFRSWGEFSRMQVGRRINVTYALLDATKPASLCCAPVNSIGGIAKVTISTGAGWSESCGMAGPEWVLMPQRRRLAKV